MSIPSCLTIKKRNDLGNAIAFVYFLSPNTISPITQSVNNGDAIKFNKYGKLAGIAWPTQTELKFLKSGTFKIEFAMNYANNNQPIQVALFLNNVQLIGAFGTSNPLTLGVSMLSGSYLIKLNANDVIKIVNVSNQFLIRSAGSADEIIAHLTVTEQ
jgi:hypothetical protein